MPTKKIMCISWNLELDIPTKDTLKATIMTAIGSSSTTWPDVIIFGVQESNSGDNLGKRLCDKDLLGGLSDPYQLIADDTFSGITKFKQIFGAKASQAVYVLTRRSAKNIQAMATTMQQKKGREKGFVFADVNIGGKRIGCVSTHLAAEDAKRPRDITQIGQFLANAAKQKKFHALFIMGDLNYRIKRNGAAADADSVLANSATMSGRASLLSEDTFDPANFFADTPYKWLPFSPYCLPTYKRSRKSKDASQINRLRPQNSGSSKVEKLTGVEDGAYPLDAIKAVYKVKASEKGENIWDFGWLDRIGFAAGGTLNDVQFTSYGSPSIITPGASITNLDTLWIDSWSHAFGGDHVPVYATFEIDGL